MQSYADNKMFQALGFFQYLIIKDLKNFSYDILKLLLEDQKTICYQYLPPCMYLREIYEPFNTIFSTLRALTPPPKEKVTQRCFDGKKSS